MKPEEHNLKEEIGDIVRRAVNIGIPNQGCGVFRVMREEHYSPRGRALILDNEIYDKILYECNLCKACEICNSNLCAAFIKARQLLVIQKKELPHVKEMIENLKKTGNIYGVKV